MVLSDKRPPMLDYVTKLSLLEVVKASAMQDIPALIWLQKYLTELHQRWEELDAKR